MPLARLKALAVVFFAALMTCACWAAEHAKISWVSIDQIEGATSDGQIDAIPALRKAAQLFAGTQGGTVHLDCGKTYTFLTPIDLAHEYPGVVVEGCLEAPDDSSASLGSMSVHVEYGQRGRIDFGPQFQATIGASSGFRNVIFTRAGVRFPVRTARDYAGTPFKTAADGAGNFAILHHVMVVGAARCLDASAGGGRLDIRDLRCDGTAGETIGPSLDTTILQDVHNWPYGTAGVQGGDNARSGTGLELATGACDDTRVEGFLDFGHRNGFLSRCNGNVWLGGRMWLDNNAGTAFGIQGSTHMQGPGSLAAATCGTCISVSDQTDVQLGSVVILSAKTNCVEVDGTFVVSSMIIRGCRKSGIALTTRSKFVAPFLQMTEVAGNFICAGLGMGTYQIVVGTLVSDLPFGTPAIQCNATALPAIGAMPVLKLPPSGTATPLVASVTGSGRIRGMEGGWGGREIVLQFAPGVVLLSSDTIELKGGAAFATGPAPHAFRFDASGKGVWYQEW